MPAARSPVRLPAAPRLAELQAALDEVRARCDVAARLAVDPVGVVHRRRGALEQELAGLLASAVAFGNVTALRAKLEDALERLGPSLVEVAGDEREVLRRLRGWKHRVYRGEDLGRLLVGARRVQREAGSLGERFAADLAREGALRPALVALTSAIRTGGGLDRDDGSGRRGARHILADPRGASGCKRLLLWLRWMVRPADGVDLGLWRVDPSVLLVPVDVHVHKLARNLGLTRRAQASWLVAEEITAALRRFDPGDPVKYDFALCHLGMSRRCPSRRDAARCDGCGVRPVCRHWRAPARDDRALAKRGEPARAPDRSPVRAGRARVRGRDKQSPA
jgi:uncharacterized protein (TIGR02757 family)